MSNLGLNTQYSNLNTNNKMAKQVKYDVEARDALKKGVDTLANAVKVTLGPKVKCVAIQNGSGVPDITRDGATIAKAVDLNDPNSSTENLTCNLYLTVL